jgi:hypothetical protein
LPTPLAGGVGVFAFERLGQPDALNPLARAGKSSSSSSKGRLHSGSRFAAQGGVDVAPPDFVAVLSMDGPHGLQVFAQWGT